MLDKVNVFQETLSPCPLMNETLYRSYHHYKVLYFTHFCFAAGFSHRNQPTSIDLNAVRLCFQVFIEDGEPDRFTYPLTPIVSDPIYDKSKP